jgi:hypothetical protein
VHRFNFGSALAWASDPTKGNQVEIERKDGPFRPKMTVQPFVSVTYKAQSVNLRRVTQTTAIYP